MAVVAIILILVFTIRLNVATVDVVGSNVPAHKIADIQQFKVFKVGTKTISGEKFLQDLGGKTSFAALPAAPDSKTLVLFDGNGDYIKANKNNQEFRAKISGIIANHDKLLSMGSDQAEFVDMLNSATGAKVMGIPQVPQLTVNGQTITYPDYALGYKVNPAGAICTSLDGKTVRDCSMIASVLGPTIGIQQILEWIGDE